MLQFIYFQHEGISRFQQDWRENRRTLLHQHSSHHTRKQSKNESSISIIQDKHRSIIQEETWITKEKGKLYHDNFKRKKKKKYVAPCAFSTDCYNVMLQCFHYNTTKRIKDTRALKWECVTIIRMCAIFTRPCATLSVFLPITTILCYIASTTVPLLE